ncbi:unnamed protein product [Adineta steineri]|uniref:BRCT domain-containing protein n=2 Tax=Adineta steineri TaxID=433720 RepID=A0A819J358_9BILA|nr:unnamed protein product [Adineta steineri]CAF3921225.1 unnamed protein product [Adineta steineri]
MSSPTSYAKGYVRWTAGGKRVMWDGCRWQQLCQIEKCFQRDQKSQGVCLRHYREQQENKAKPKNKKFKTEDKIKSNKETKSSQIQKKTSISTRSRRIKSNHSLNGSTKVSDTDIQNSDANISDSEIIPARKSSTSNTSPSKSQKSSRKLVLVCSSLSRQQLSQVELFCTRFSAQLSNQVDETTTHLIASEVEQRICCLTKKVFFAVAYHQYVIGYQWIEECLTKQTLLNEESYEILGDASLSSQHNGMNRSRLIHEPIFKSYSYAIAVECSIGCQQGMFTRQELEKLVQLSGAILLQEHNREELDNNTTIIVLCDDDDKMVVTKYNDLKNKIYYVIPEFFLDSLVLYEIYNMDGFVAMTNTDRFDKSLHELVNFAESVKLREKELEDQHNLELERLKTEYDTQLQIEQKRVQQLRETNQTLKEQCERGIQQHIDHDANNAKLLMKYNISLEECKQIKEQHNKKNVRIEELERIARILQSDKDKLVIELTQVKTDNQNLHDKIKELSATPPPATTTSQNIPDEFIRLVEKAVAENNEFKRSLGERDNEIQKLTEQLNKVQSEDPQIVEQRLLQTIAKLKNDFRIMYENQSSFFLQKIDLLKQEQRDNIANLYKH